MPADSVAERDRLLLMAGKLYRFMTPLGVLAVATGLWLWLGYGITGGWMHAKFALVLVLLAYHVYLGKLLADFKHDRNAHGHVFYRWLNEIPALPILVAVVFLVVMKPF